MSHDIQYLPTAPNTTYIVFKAKVNEKEIKEWIDIVSFRLVFVVDDIPKLSKEIKERIIIHESLFQNKETYFRAIQNIFRYSDRQYVFNNLRETNAPVPLALAWLKSNHDSDAQKWRILADCVFTLPDIYAHSIMAFCVKGKPNSPTFPKSSKKDNEETPLNYRDSDKYINTILSQNADFRNELRDKQNEQSLINKRKERILDWL